MKRAIEVLNDLTQKGIIRAYAIGGAMGAAFYLEPVSTFDLDVFVLFADDESLAPLTPLYAALAAMGFHPDETARECVDIAGTPVQFLPVHNALLAEAMEEARQMEYDGVPVRVVDPEHLAAIAVQTGRPKDAMRLAMFREWDGFDETKFRAILAAHGLAGDIAHA